MTDFQPFEYAMLGFILGILIGFVGVIFWKSMDSRGRPRRRRVPKTISCLMCGRPNPVGPEEHDCSRLVCRCGQSIYIVGQYPHPHPRPH